LLVGIKAIAQAGDDVTGVDFIAISRVKRRGGSVKPMMMRPLPLAPGLGEFAVGVEVLELPQLTIRKLQQRNKPRN
jgi:hypothetical protein